MKAIEEDKLYQKNTYEHVNEQGYDWPFLELFS
ncbi:hypothetical protein MGE_04356 [Candida albicans P75010]|nr:hypothetical protein MGE_04356 [Candida albicans P75010]